VLQTVCYRFNLHASSREATPQIEAPFVSAALGLLKDVDKFNTTAALWADHKWNGRKYLSPPHIYSFSWPLTTENDQT